MRCLVKVAAFFVLVAGFAACQPQNEQQTGMTTTEFPRAMPGDSVWIILNHVRPDQRETFESFVETVLMPALEEVGPASPLYSNLLDHGRILYPTAANGDSTFTYVYMLG